MSCATAIDYSKVTFPGGYSPWETRGDCTFDADAAQTAVDFFPEFLIHEQGSKGGQPFDLEPWEQNIVATIYGWKRPDGFRRYRLVYIEIPRGNGKSFLCCGFVCLMMYVDDEHGAKIYSAAGTREQAKEVFRPVVYNVKENPALSSVSECNVNHIIRYSDRGVPVATYKAISAEAGYQMGGNPHGIIFDELHVQKDRRLWDALHTGKIKRDEPLTIAITTAGFDKHSICYEQRSYAEKVRDGILDDKAAREFLPVIYAAEKDDDWTDPAVWRKANPNLGVSIKEEDFAKECARAKESPAYENTFKRLHLNIWTEQETRWLAMDKWDVCGTGDDKRPEHFDTVQCLMDGRLGFAGLDLAATQDLTSLVFISQADDGVYDVLPYFWLPEETARERARRDRVPYLQWIDQGYIKTTPGSAMDDETVRRDVNEICSRLRVQTLAIDRNFQGAWLSRVLSEDGIDVAVHGQGFMDMAAPTGELEKLILRQGIRHYGNPVLRWMASNVTVKQDAAGNYKPDKEKSSEKIDGIVSLIMAIGLAIKTGPPQESIYMTRGIRSI